MVGVSECGSMSSEKVNGFGGFLSHGGSPIAGWFVMENPIF